MKPLTSLDEERLSRRLIAQLAEEEDWDASLAAAAGARFDDEDDEDYAPKVGGSRKRKAPAKKPKEPKEPKAARARKSASSAQAAQELSSAASATMPGAILPDSSSLGVNPTMLMAASSSAAMIAAPELLGATEIDPSALLALAASAPMPGSFHSLMPSVPLSNDEAMALAKAIPPPPKRRRKSQPRNSDAGEVAPANEENPNFKRGTFTDDEEVKFLEGLDDWRKMSEHMGTRSIESIKSHAQKHFIKLFRDNKPLPPKVLESGDGYTLSGKPLDPQSAAARPYLREQFPSPPPAATQGDVSRAASIANQEVVIQPSETAPGMAAPAFGIAVSENQQEVRAFPVQTGKNVAEKRKIVRKPKDPNAPPKPRKRKSAAGAEGELAPVDGAVEDVDMEAVDGPGNKETTGMEGQQDAGLCAQPDEHPAVPNDSHEQATKIVEPESAEVDVPPPLRMQLRSRGANAAGQANGGSTRGEKSEHDHPLSLVTPGWYPANQQPFAVQLPLSALLTMELASHLSATEVVGFLEGEWNSETKVVTVVQAYPCRPAVSMPTEVEADPVHELAIREMIQSHNVDMSSATKVRRVVGWYHSHPFFAACPSHIDIETQEGVQNTARESELLAVDGSGDAAPAAVAEGNKVSPYLGLIISPYEPSNTAPHSALTVFTVTSATGQDHYQHHSHGRVPMRIEWDPVGVDLLSEKEQASELKNSWMTELVRPHLSSPRISMSDVIVCSTSAASTSNLAPGNMETMTRMQKLYCAFQSRIECAAKVAGCSPKVVEEACGYLRFLQEAFVRSNEE